MRIMTDVVVRVEAMSPAPVFRASEEFASACRPVFGQECFGSAAAAWQAESVSGAGLAGAARFPGLPALGEGLLERHGYAGLPGQERPRPVFQPVPAPLTGWVLVDEKPVDVQPVDVQPLDEQQRGEGNGDGSGIGISERDDDSSKGDNGTKPMTPWDFRTSSPPG